jgi:pimeloyl-[acyl-carrier protein] methyl ester esterase
MKTKLFFVSGWAIGSKAINPLAECLHDQFDCVVLSAEEVLPPGALSSAITANRSQSTDPCVLAGWSLGGMLAIASAGSLASGSALVLISSTARFCQTPESPYGVPMAQLRAMKLGLRRRPEATLSSFFEQVAKPHQIDPQAATRLAKQQIDADSRRLVDGLQYLSDADLADAASATKAATLVLHGRDDQVIAPQASIDLSKRIKGAQLRLCDGVGHDLPIREPEWTALSISNFWKTHAAATHAR